MTAGLATAVRKLLALAERHYRAAGGDDGATSLLPRSCRWSDRLGARRIYAAIGDVRWRGRIGMPSHAARVSSLGKIVASVIRSLGARGARQGCAGAGRRTGRCAAGAADCRRGAARQGQAVGVVTADLAHRFPRTVEGLSGLPDPAATLRHILLLEEGFGTRADPLLDKKGPDRNARPEFDVALAGGGLSLIYAALLAQRGWRVVVFDRGAIGVGHREWNISRPELAPLMASGLFTADEVDTLVETAYDHGIVRWHRGGTYPVRGVLDCVIRAEPFLAALRDRAGAAGATLLPSTALVGYRAGVGGLALELLQNGAPITLTTRLLLDGTGASSPHARFDLCCPTVGGVLGGLTEGSAPDEVDPRVGEILVTTEDEEEGRQHIWEGFPGADQRFTTYLFYYVQPNLLSQNPLFELYERFFLTRNRYKKGDGRLLRPTYGFIPAYTRLAQMPAAPRDRVLLVGDAAARHSPLTFCGFGSMIRSFLPVGTLVSRLLEADQLDRRSLAKAWDLEPAALKVMGALTLMMSPRSGSRRQAGDVNDLLDAAFASLAEMGNDVFGAFVRDETSFDDFLRFMTRTAERRPSIYREVFAQLTPREIAVWSVRFAGFRLAGL